MKKYSLLFTLICFFAFPSVKAQDMDNDKLNSIIYTLSDRVEGSLGNWQFVIDSVLFICLTDQNYNRMRIISPIEKVENISEEQIMECMEANFHTALDVKYAISDKILWGAFIHPLKELTIEQVMSAISQVYSSVKTFGSTYSSGALNFPKTEEEKEEELPTKQN